MAIRIEHKVIGQSTWYHLETAKTVEAATARARGYVLDHGGYVRVIDENGQQVPLPAFYTGQ